MVDEEVAVVEEVVPEVVEPELPLEPEAKADEGAADEVVAETPEVVAEPERPAVDWRDKELKKKHAQNMEAKRQIAERDAKIAALEALAAAQGGQQAPQPPAAQSDSAAIDAAADRKLAQRQYDEDCNKVASEGEKTYGAEWKGAIENLQTLGGFTPEAMRGLLATDDPKKVLFELGKNPERYYQISELPLERQIIEMGKLAMTAIAAKKVSEAPPPVAPVGGRASPASSKVLTDNMDDDQAYAVLQEMRRKRVAARGR